MRYCVYFVPHPGIHPCASLDLYSKLWPIMHRSVRKLGHRLVHITDMDTPCWGDDVFRVDVAAETTIYSRDVAWLRYVRSLPDGEQACMIEPDTFMLRSIPPLRTGCDMALLSRPNKGIPGWFKLATNRAVPFYEEVVAQYDNLPEEMRVFHGDIGAMHRTLGFPDMIGHGEIPRSFRGVRIETRPWINYGFRKGVGKPFFLQFKGNSKEAMLKLAKLV